MRSSGFYATDIEFVRTIEGSFVPSAKEAESSAEGIMNSEQPEEHLQVNGTRVDSNDDELNEEQETAKNFDSFDDIFDQEEKIFTEGNDNPFD